MKVGGIGGANTKTGKDFEISRDFLEVLTSQRGYGVTRHQVWWADIAYGGKVVAHSIRQHSLYRFLSARNINWKALVSKKLLPDEAIFVPDKRLISVIEMKYQQTPGSVDEKLQTCHFKIRQYRKLLEPLGCDVEYIYLLGEWFQKPEYRDVLQYIGEVGCRYYFDDLPLNEIGLPE